MQGDQCDVINVVVQPNPLVSIFFGIIVVIGAVCLKDVANSQRMMSIFLGLMIALTGIVPLDLFDQCASIVVKGIVMLFFLGSIFGVCISALIIVVDKLESN